MFLEFIRAFGFIFVAEMGDKTQILAMAFATKYKLKKVLLGIFIGSLLNHGIAVLVGASLSSLIDQNMMSIIAGFAFIIFGLWSLKIDQDEDEKNSISKYGPTVTVAIAFFIGELGDKTQLTAITLSTEASYPLFILMGTVLGMVVTGLIGIFVGIKLGSKVPELYIKLGAAIIFYIFGIIKLSSSLPSEYLTTEFALLFSFISISISTFLLWPLFTQRRETTAFKQTAKRLHAYYHKMERQLEKICLGEDVCGTCSLNNCIVGYTKSIIKSAHDKGTYDKHEYNYMFKTKVFNKEKVLESLILTIHELKEDPLNKKYDILHEVRKNLEHILIGSVIKDFVNYEEYLIQMKKKNVSIFNSIVIGGTI